MNPEFCFIMSYRRIIIGDVNVGRFWLAAQSARPQLREVPLRNTFCLDTLEASLDGVSDELDMVILSVMTSLITEEGSAADVSGSASNIIDQAIRRVVGCAKKSKRCEVVVFSFYSIGCRPF